MQQKIAIRKKALVFKKKKYFKITSKFFFPLIKLLKKKKIPQRTFHSITLQIMKLIF